MAATRATHIADTSAFARLRYPSVSAVLGPLIEAGRLATCGVLELEVLCSAQPNLWVVPAGRSLERRRDDLAAPAAGSGRTRAPARFG